MKNDFAAPGTTYAVVLTVTDTSTGNVLVTSPTVYATTGTKVGP